MVGPNLIRKVSVRLISSGLMASCLLSSAVIKAQNAGAAGGAASTSLAPLEQAVKDRTAEWIQLSQNLDSSLIRLLPCDPKVAASLAAVSKASEARVAAVAAYVQAANRQAQLQANAAKQVAASAQAIGTEFAAEKSDLAPERSGAEGQLANLTQSMQRRAALAAPEDSLKQVLTSQQQRSDAIDSAVSRADQANVALANLVMQLQARQAASDGVQTAFEAEGARWSAYYSARRARAQMECAITKGTPAPAAKGKQK